MSLDQNAKQANISEEVKECLLLVQTLRLSMRPIEGHDDPGSIEDCWNELEDGLTRINDLV